MLGRWRQGIVDSHNVQQQLSTQCLHSCTHPFSPLSMVRLSTAAVIDSVPTELQTHMLIPVCGPTSRSHDIIVRISSTQNPSRVAVAMLVIIPHGGTEHT